MIDWDLYDQDMSYDPWNEWRSGARDMMRNDCTERTLGEHMDKEPWDENDEPRYLAALLAAGPEPKDYAHEEHMAWQGRASEVLMQKFRNHWWFNMSAPTPRKGKMDPKYRTRAQEVRADVATDELTKFYTWLCQERKEGWTRNLVPKGLY